MTGAREEAERRRLYNAYLTKAGTVVEEAVVAGNTTKAVAFDLTEPDATYGVCATPNWSTTCFVTSKATSGFTLNFGTAAPGGGGKVDWIVFRS